MSDQSWKTADGVKITMEYPDGSVVTMNCVHVKAFRASPVVSHVHDIVMINIVVPDRMAGCSVFLECQASADADGKIMEYRTPEYDKGEQAACNSTVKRY